ncbi:hypothetical protein [Nostoc sp.]
MKTFLLYENLRLSYGDREVNTVILLNLIFYLFFIYFSVAIA